MHAPAVQTVPRPQLVHAVPLFPQADEVCPPSQVPADEQQPVGQFEGPHAGVGGVQVRNRVEIANATNRLKRSVMRQLPEKLVQSREVAPWQLLPRPGTGTAVQGRYG